MALGFIFPFVSYYGGTDEDGDDWEITRGINPGVKLAQDSARNTFSYFVDALERAGDGAEGFQVQVKLQSKDNIPTAVWLSGVSISSIEMKGKLTVTPPGGLQDDLVEGDRTSFARYQVLDWRYPEDGRWRGNFVLRVSLVEYSTVDQEEIGRYLHESPLP